MYKAYMGEDSVLYDPAIERLPLIEPVLELEMGTAGSFTFTIPPAHPLYDSIFVRSSKVIVMRDGAEVFFGEARSIKTDFYRNKTVYCVGALGFLADSVLESSLHVMGRRSGILNTMVAAQNRCVGEGSPKRFAAGTMDGQDTVLPMAASLTMYDNVLEWGRKMIADNGGGYLQVRHEVSALYLDWHLPAFAPICSQEIRFGENLLDYAQAYDADGICTVLIPLGKAQSETSGWINAEKRIEISSVNGGLNYLTDAAAAAACGQVWQQVIFDEIEDPAKLKEAGQAYLDAHKAPDITLRLTAADLSALNADFDAFEVGQKVHCVSEPHGAELWLPVTKLTIPLDDPAGRKLELSDTRKGTYTEMQNKAGKRLEGRDTALWQAV